MINLKMVGCIFLIFRHNIYIICFLNLVKNRFSEQGENCPPFFGNHFAEFREILSQSNQFLLFKFKKETICPWT